ncbi:MAG: FkbM family methyltransferase [Pyrobaculum sp.]
MDCKKLLWGVWLTVKTLGLVVLIREVIRRWTGVGYTYRGIPIRTVLDYIALREVRRRYDIRREGDQIVVSTGYGQLAVGLNDVSTLHAVGEPIEDMYAADVKGGVVLDVGAGIGDSTLFFVSRGARRVYAFEPVEKHFRYLVDNVARNNAVDRVVAFNYGLWVEDGVLKVKYESLGTGPYCRRRYRAKG